MSEIVSFPPQEGQARKSRASTETTGAQILFFTGVRYERMTDPAPALVEGDSGAPRSGGVGGARGGKRRRRV
jgi:hypothetical protein